MSRTRATTSGGMFLDTPLVSTQDSEPILSVEVATVADVGVVKPDGSTITITADGTISAPGGGGGGGGPTTQTPYTFPAGSVTMVTAFASVLIRVSSVLSGSSFLQMNSDYRAALERGRNENGL